MSGTAMLSLFHLPRPARIDVHAETVVLTQEASHRTEVSLQQHSLQQALTELVGPVRHALRADVVVSVSHTRLFVLPFSAALSSEARWNAYAASRFEDLFGEVADGWSLRVVAERPGRPRLVAALPMGLMRTLESLLDRRLRSVRIDSLTWLDEMRRRESGYTGALVDVGAQQALVALMIDGSLHRLRLRRMTPSLEELRAALTVEWAALGRSDVLPALAIAPGDVLDTSDSAELRALAPRLIRLH
jgi:hypothetical protein